MSRRSSFRTGQVSNRSSRCADVQVCGVVYGVCQCCKCELESSSSYTELDRECSSTLGPELEYGAY